MNSPQTLDLFVLNGCKPDSAVVLARRGPDIATAQLALKSSDIDEFVSFTDRVERVVLGEPRPTVKELDRLGKRLFGHIFSGEILRLYNRLPNGRVSIQIATDEPMVHRIPWEYLTPFDRVPVPHQERCVVRIVAMCAPADPAPARARKRLKVLLAVADPVGLPGVGWEDVEARYRDWFGAQTEFIATLKIVPGATSKALLRALNTERFDVFHFLGHGGVVNGQGQLVLVDVDTQQPDYVGAQQISAALAGQGLRLCILSACLTGAGDFKDDFGPIAAALLRAGIPAVVANQTSIPTKSVAPFVGALYARLLSEGNIDAAVMAGRVALQDDLRKGVAPGLAVVEWGIPTLYRLPGDGQLFSKRKTS
jgi:hypothetical protein